MDHQIDSLDRKILGKMREDSRKSLLEIGRELGVAGATIHSRVSKLRDSGVIKGSKLVLDHKTLGFNVHAFVGVSVSRAGKFRDVIKMLEELPEITEVHYTTGGYSLFIKVSVRLIEDLHMLLSEKIQSIPDIQATETFIILNTTIDREIELK